MSGDYWIEFRDAWEMRAIACVDGHQDIFRLTGRDPVTNPLTAIELAVFTMLCAEHAQKRAQLAVLTSAAPFGGL